LIERQSSNRVPIVGNTRVTTAIRFNGLGQPMGGGFQGGTLHVCAILEPVSQHQVVLASNGRVSLRSHKTAQALCVGGEDSEQGADA
jgi:type IV fimbrial biogenesis protein FimT